MTNTQIPSIRAVWLALILCGSSTMAATVELRRGRTGETNLTHESATPTVQGEYLFCVDDIEFFYLSVYGGPRNSTVSFNVLTNPRGTLGLSLSSVGPYTESLVIPVALDSNGYGERIFYTRGEKPGAGPLYGCSSLLGCTNMLNVAVVSVSSVQFEAIDSPLDANPNSGGGMRMYPEKRTATDTTDRKKVRVVASLNPARPGVPLHFRSFDLDDPSTDVTIVDPNGPAGNDNRGTPQCGTLNTAGCAAQATTDGSGQAKLEFTTTVQPGDNFRIAASCNSTYLQGVTVDGLGLKGGDNQALPNIRAGQSDPLTVWRRVHIEVDSMGAVHGNQLRGSILLTQPSTSSGITTLFVDRGLEDRRFERGLLKIDGVGSFSVQTNALRTVTVRGVLANMNGRRFTLMDDDDFNSDDASALDGDEGEDVSAPDLSLIQDSDNPASNVFAPAYVRPLYDIGDNNSSVPFLLNEVGDGSAELIATYDFDAMGTEADPEFWTVYVLGAYQHLIQEDGDPSSEGVTLGIVDDINGLGASVFNEVLRPSETNITAVVNNAATTAHEVGHLFSGEHPQQGLMSQSSGRTTTAFSDETLNVIRSISHP